MFMILLNPSIFSDLTHVNPDRVSMGESLKIPVAAMGLQPGCLPGPNKKRKSSEWQ